MIRNVKDFVSANSDVYSLFVHSRNADVFSMVLPQVFMDLGTEITEDEAFKIYQYLAETQHSS